MLEKLVLTARITSPAVAHEIITLRPPGVVGDRLRDCGIPVHSLQVRGVVSALVAFFELVSRLGSCSPEVIVQTWMYHADLMGGLAARFAGLPRVIWNVRRSGIEPQALRARTRLIVRACGLLSRWVPESIIVNSRRAMTAHCTLGYKPARFVYIPNGFDASIYTRLPAARSELRRQWGIGDQELVVGLVARVEPQKDHPNFIAMAKKVWQAIPQTRFVLVGRGIPQDHAIGLAIRREALQDRFVLCDQRSDIPAVMSALDIFCLSSRTEGFPNVLGEAMACETPCVTTDCGDAPDILGDDTRVAPPGDPQALADRVIHLALMPRNARERLGREQRRRIVERFDIVAVWREYLKLYARE